jgi:hypothetical protein
MRGDKKGRVQRGRGRGIPPAAGRKYRAEPVSEENSEAAEAEMEDEFGTEPLSPSDADAVAEASG